jgi:hypothetical protein
MSETLIPDVPLEDEEAYRQAPEDVLRVIMTNPSSSDRDRVLAAKSLAWHEHQRAKQEAVKAEEGELQVSDYHRFVQRLYKHASNEQRVAIRGALKNAIAAYDREARRKAREAKARAAA